MFDDVRRVILALSERAQARGVEEAARLMAIRTAASLRKARLGADLKGFAAVEATHVTETSSWVGAETLAQGEGGPFDCLDLRCWLALAERAGVPHVPALTVLELDDAEMDVLSGEVRTPAGPVTRGILRMLATAGTEATASDPIGQRIDTATLEERVASAMDPVPEGWMVRYMRCGGSDLKALAGAGVAGPVAPEVRFGPDLELGPGWVRAGNRRRVDVANARTVESAASAPADSHAFLARPWALPARWAYGEDPHRHGSAYAGKGAWPAEWRAFVVDGRVEGVGSYYAWCGAATPRNARVALDVRALAQRVADECVRQGAFPRFDRLEQVRSSGRPDLVTNPVAAAELGRLGRDKVAMTIDFIEVHGGPGEHGLMMLEAGPANSLWGGGHPVAFAGAGGVPRNGARAITEGMAFRLMDHVSLMEPSTWSDGDRAGRVLSWNDVGALAASDGPSDEVPESLRVGAPPSDYRSPVG